MISNKLLLALLVMVSLVAIYGLTNKRVEYQQGPPVVINTQSPILREYKDPAGQNHAVIDAEKNAYTASDFKKAPDLSAAVDSAIQALEISRSQVKEWQQIAMESKANELRAKKRMDSLKRLVYYYKNKNIEITFRPDSNDGVFGYKYNVKLDQLQYREKKILFGKRATLIDIWPDDSLAKINNVERFTIKAKEPLFDVKAKASIMGTNVMTDVQSGAGLELRFGKAHLGGFYMYSLRDEKWRPMLRLDYDILTY